tara:strand:- start:2436 stop:3341 length:906 start_codon:yes stop_codon:yes gene_type:complete
VRVVSLVPSATELLCAAGGEHMLVGRSHECDWPPSIMDRPSLTRARTGKGTPSEIEAEVVEAISQQESLYEIDAERIRALQPDLILTQDLCDVCSIDLNSVRALASSMPDNPEIVSLNPTCIEDVFDDLLRIGSACGLESEARKTLAQMRERWWHAQDFVNAYVDGPQVAVVEWTDPLYIAGHWTPDLVRAAGGRHDLNQSGAVSRRITPEDLLELMPEKLVICPCGRTLEEATIDAQALVETSWWSLLPAVQDSQVMVVDGNAMFSRPGPRLITAMEWLTSWFQQRPELHPPDFPAASFA